MCCLPDELTAGDFDGDGRLDVAVVSRDNQIVILLGLGDGHFVRSNETRVGNRPEVLLWKDVDGTPLDLNGDDVRDLVTANSQSNSVSVLLGRGDGSFEPEYRLPVGNVPHTMLALDVNQDGRTDLVTVNEGSDDLSILLGYGDGRFAVGAIKCRSTEGKPRSMLGDSPWAIVAKDFDRDDHPDFAVANRVSNNVTVLYSTKAVAGGLQFRRVDFPVGNFPEWIAAADGNGDGLLDLVTANRLSHDVSILVGHTDPSARTPFWPNSVSPKSRRNLVSPPMTCPVGIAVITRTTRTRWSPITSFPVDLRPAISTTITNWIWRSRTTWPTNSASFSATVTGRFNPRCGSARWPIRSSLRRGI